MEQNICLKKNEPAEQMQLTAGGGGKNIRISP